MDGSGIGAAVGIDTAAPFAAPRSLSAGIIFAVDDSLVDGQAYKMSTVFPLHCPQVNDLLISLIARTLGDRLECIYLVDCPKLSRVSLDVLVTTVRSP